jgi:hypothetical protein
MNRFIIILLRFEKLLPIIHTHTTRYSPEWIIWIVSEKRRRVSRVIGHKRIALIICFSRLSLMHREHWIKRGIYNYTFSNVPKKKTGPIALPFTSRGEGA